MNKTSKNSRRSLKEILSLWAYMIKLDH